MSDSDESSLWQIPSAYPALTDHVSEIKTNLVACLYQLHLSGKVSQIYKYI